MELTELETAGFDCIKSVGYSWFSDDVIAPLPVLPSPSITGIFGRLAILFFINTKIKKRFLVSISPAVTPFLAEFVTHELLC